MGLNVSHLNLEAVIANDQRLAVGAKNEGDAQRHLSRAASVVRLALKWPAQSDAEQAAKDRIAAAFA